MPFVEDYSNWKQLDSITNYEPLRDYFYANPDVWQARPTQGFFSECGWYKFPYCCNVPWYQELNTPEIIGHQRAKLYELAKPFFDYANNQLGTDFLFWGAELNSVPLGVSVASHYDKHFYSEYATRVHVVLQTNNQVNFQFEKSTHHFAEGECFLFNNKLTHGIQNNGTTDRLHLVMDFVPAEIFKYAERSIGPFGGNFGSKHVVSYLTRSNKLYSQFIKLAGNIELYPCKTRQLL
jgi:hypothetical protein